MSSPPSFWHVAAAAALLFGIAAAGTTASAQTHPAGSGHSSPAAQGDPASMPAASDNSDAHRSVSEYVIPNVTLVREDGKSVNLPAEMNDGRPVVLNFVYTSCTTICPMSSQVFEQFQGAIEGGSDAVHLMSISIDPEQDTPTRLKAYAATFHAQANWNHYSGSLSAVTAVQRAFNAYRGDKMSHVPLTLVRAAPGAPWVRFDGFARADDLLAERAKWATSKVARVAP